MSPGWTGLAEFKACVRTLFGFPHDATFDVVFECLAPEDQGQRIMLNGFASFDAAQHCAAVSAGSKRIMLSPR